MPVTAFSRAEISVHYEGNINMTAATLIALGAAAIGLLVFAFCIFVAVNAKKQQDSEAAKPDKSS